MVKQTTESKTSDGMASCRAIEEWVRDGIASGLLKPDDPLPSARDLGAKFDVSYQTAYRAMKTLADRGVIYQVQGRGSFIKPRNQVIGVIDTSSYSCEEAWRMVFDSFWEAAEDELKLRNINVNHISGGLAMLRGQLDGILDSVNAIITDIPFVEADNNAEKLREWAKPVVLVKHDSVFPYPFHQVVADAEIGFREGIERLLQRGHRKIAICGQETITDRIELYRRLAAEYKLDHSPERELLSPRLVGDLGRLGGMKMGIRYLRQCRDCTAIFCLSDFYAFGMVDALREEGIEPGRDIDLISYDDFEGDGMSPYPEPFLTSIRKPRRRAGIQAAKICMDAIADNNVVIRTHKLPTHLVIRHSG